MKSIPHKRYFVTYADEKFACAGARIIKEAKSLGHFTECFLLTPNDVPDTIKNSCLWRFQRGGGYWVWKPWAISRILSQIESGALLFYADAGCQLYKSREWMKFFTFTQRNTFMFFRIQGFTIRWVRRILREAFPYGDKKTSMICAGTAMMMINTKRTRELILLWLSTMLEHPEYVMDVPKQDRLKEDVSFIENRHDQAVLSGLLYKYKSELGKCVRWEHFEQKAPDGWQAIWAARNCSGVRKVAKVSVVRYFFRRMFIYPITFFRGVIGGSL